MFTLINKIKSGKWLIASAAALALAAPSFAGAQDYRNDFRDHRDIEHHDIVRHDDDRRDFEHHDFDHRDFDHHDFDRALRVEHRDWISDRFAIDFRVPNFEVSVAQPVVQRQWIEPVYQTVDQAVWVPDQFDDRPVTFFDHGRRFVRVDRILVSPGHYETRPTQVLIAPGHWADAAPACVSPDLAQ